jgi:hypothetical protein
MELPKHLLFLTLMPSPTTYLEIFTMLIFDFLSLTNKHPTPRRSQPRALAMYSPTTYLEISTMLIFDFLPLTNRYLAPRRSQHQAHAMHSPTTYQEISIMLIFNFLPLTNRLPAPRRSQCQARTMQSTTHWIHSSNQTSIRKFFPLAYDLGSNVLNTNRTETITNRFDPKGGWTSP